MQPFAYSPQKHVDLNYKCTSLNNSIQTLCFSKFNPFTSISRQIQFIKLKLKICVWVNTKRLQRVKLHFRKSSNYRYYHTLSTSILLFYIAKIHICSNCNFKRFNSWRVFQQSSPPLALRFGDKFPRTIITRAAIINAQYRGNIRVLITK